MPIFEYVCKACGKEFEELVFGNAAVTCPVCASTKTEKLMSRCRHKSGGGGGDYAAASASSGGGGCSGCAGGNCASCK